MAIDKLELQVNLASKGFAEPLNLQIPLDGVTALFGPSGSGKTSLLRAIAGLDRHLETTVRYAGQTWQSNKEFIPTHQRRLAYVFQEPSLFPHLTVEGNIKFATDRAKKIETANGISQASIYDTLNITHLLTRFPDTLSGGESQRVALARALSSNPRLLLMDEPLSALDAGHKSEIIPLLEYACSEFGLPAIYVSHSLQEVTRLADTLVLLEAGQVISVGRTKDVLVKLDLPYAHQPDAISVLNGFVLEHESQFSITQVQTEAGKLSLLKAGHLAIGQAVKIQISARDVSITKEISADTSILNRFAVMIVDIADVDASQAVLKLESNGVTILSKVTKKSIHAMNLKVGQSVIAQVKSCALL